MKKILFIEDSIQSLNIMTLDFSSRGFAVISAGTGTEGIRKSLEENPDLITLDIGLPDMNGLIVLKELRKFYKNHIIMVTALGDSDTIVEAIKLGANDYIIKPFDMDKLFEKVNKNLSPDFREIQGTFIKTGQLFIEIESRFVSIKNNPVHLSKIEFDILKYFANNIGKAVSSHELIVAIWGENTVHTTDNLKPHIINLKHKIEDDPSNPKYILTHRGFGYKLNAF